MLTFTGCDDAVKRRANTDSIERRHEIGRQLAVWSAQLLACKQTCHCADCINPCLRERHPGIRQPQS